MEHRRINGIGGAELGGTNVASATLSVGGANIPLLGFGTYGMSGWSLPGTDPPCQRPSFGPTTHPPKQHPGT